MPNVIIRHSDGREYEISTSDFRRGKHAQQPDGSFTTYEEAGFRIVSQADGQPYQPPAPRVQPGEHSPS